MPSQPLLGKEPLARRDLRREEMTRFAADIPWLHDPDLIPASATEFLKYTKAKLEDPYMNLGFWMIEQLAEWSEKAHLKLGYGPTFDKYDLDSEARVRIRQEFQTQALSAYGPGIGSMAEIVGLVPALAIREGVDRSQWTVIATQAQDFGEALAHDGTHAQAVLRDYLSDPEAAAVVGMRALDPAQLRLDAETGITTNIPVADLMAAAKFAADNAFFREEHSGVCVALQAPLAEFGGASTYSVIWDAYVSAANRLIYSQIDPDTLVVRPQVEPDPHFAQTMYVNAMQEAYMFINGLKRTL